MRKWQGVTCIVPRGRDEQLKLLLQQNQTNKTKLTGSLLHIHCSEISTQGREITPQVQLSTNCKLGCFIPYRNIFKWTNSPFYGWLASVTFTIPSPCVEVSLSQRLSLKSIILPYPSMIQLMQSVVYFDQCLECLINVFHA